ncbi:MAG TPA: VOC family protein, partial [Candidatus Acidoferrales bacterium]|nr:VOC family protein [Candidatus Acidoferrales bacterium]
QVEEAFAMSAQNAHIRHGFGTVRPYLFGPTSMREFVKQAFGAEEIECLKAGGGNGFHVESKIGDSVIVMEVCDPPHPRGTPASVYVYVEDVDATYKRALAAGATSIGAPEEKPYAERAAGVTDPYGNTWYFAMHKRAR